MVRLVGGGEGGGEGRNGINAQAVGHLTDLSCPIAGDRKTGQKNHMDEYNYPGQA